MGGRLPSAGITQMLKSRICEVNAIHLPSGDQSGSVGLGVPTVLSYCNVPPQAGTFANRRRSLPLCLVAKQIQSPFGDQVGEESSTPVVRRFKFEPSALHTQMFGLPDLLKTIAIFEPSGETDALVFKPE